ncbi:MAG TPA: GrpB family protein [Candidatus Paceibacterota bacterium]|nr:GrpB family protein [Candidatus Paceibacterota bacterium]
MEKRTALVPHSNEWKILFEKEASLIKDVFGSTLLEIEHVGSTSIPDIMAKPIIDIAVQIQHHKDAGSFLNDLEKLGYIYNREKSSTERHFLQKGDPINFHLSIAYLDRGGYFKRQILFRDYLISHEDARREYEQIKLEGLNKGDFVQKILLLAEPC